jgi:hypothetical protein
MRLATGTRTGPAAALGVAAHGAEHDAPQRLPIPEQPFTAIATGAATSVRSTVRRIKRCIIT